MLLAHGATRREASRDVIRDAVRTGLVPVVNMMVAAGIVSIPGMMTGQILSGEDPFDAARYQIFILFLIAGGVALGTVGMVLAASRQVKVVSMTSTDTNHQFRNALIIVAVDGLSSGNPFLLGHGFFTEQGRWCQWLVQAS